MAVAVDFRRFTPQNSREDLVRKIEQAPVENAQAVLAAYELLENLHDKGVLDVLNGALTAGEAVIDHVVGLISSKEAVTALRIGLILTGLLKSIDADKLAAVLADTSNEPPSLLAIGRMATSPDARRAMATGLGLLNVFGAALNNTQPEKHG
jgi:uncharacterized protein YjgD (DUF1641 family)